MRQCRLCGTHLKDCFLSLGNAPLANSNLMETELHRAETYYPLELFVCEKCYLVQLDEFETASTIFLRTTPISHHILKAGFSTARHT